MASNHHFDSPANVALHIHLVLLAYAFLFINGWVLFSSNQFEPKDDLIAGNSGEGSPFSLIAYPIIVFILLGLRDVSDPFTLRWSKNIFCSHGFENRLPMQWQTRLVMMYLTQHICPGSLICKTYCFVFFRSLTSIWQQFRRTSRLVIQQPKLSSLRI